MVNLKELETYLEMQETDVDTTVQKLANLQRYVKRWIAEQKAILGISQQPDATIGLSCDDTVKLDSMPSNLVIETGIYVLRNDPNHTVFIEVVDYDVTRGIVRISNSFRGNEGESFISVGMFDRLFTRYMVDGSSIWNHNKLEE